MADLTSRAAVHYLGRTLSRAESGQHDLAFAAYLSHHGVGPGDRVMLQLQNMPQVLIACKAAWRLGATVVPINPMYKTEEVRRLANDCRPKVAVVLDELYESVFRPLRARFSDLAIVTTAASDYAAPQVAARMGLEATVCEGTDDFIEVISQAPAPGENPEFDRSNTRPDDIAALVYTSGTTGPPKGAMITHGNLSAETALWQAALSFEPDDAIMNVAPFFHITGLIADLAVSLDLGVPLVCMYRFDADWALEWTRTYRPTSIVAAITVYTALLRAPNLSADDVTSFRHCLSGGAPVSPTTVRRWQEVTGKYIRNCYGLTESSSLATLAPARPHAPVDPTTGALSVGRAVAGTSVTIRDLDDRALGPDEVGEVVIAGPQVASGYWEKPEETRRAFRSTGLHTGDVGCIDADGWLFLLDRSKDLIVSSGYKIWPREVEDLLMQHPAVLEVGVVGVPDEYRGEKVVAYVTLRPGLAADEGELIDFCRERVAVYKAPRAVTFMAELPKTASGKIMRRVLREPG